MPCIVMSAQFSCTACTLSQELGIWTGHISSKGLLNLGSAAQTVCTYHSKMCPALLCWCQVVLSGTPSYVPKVQLAVYKLLPVHFSPHRHARSMFSDWKGRRPWKLPYRKLEQSLAPKTCHEYDGGEKDNSLPGRVSAHRVGGLDNCELYWENCLMRLLLVPFVIRHISSSHLTNQTCTFSNLKELHHGFIRFISWQILLAMEMIVGDSHLKLISSTILQERTGERNIVHVKGYNSRKYWRSAFFPEKSFT